MPSGQLMTMPVLIVNMGGEMVYILEQRLQAQQIPEEKGQKVLNDVVRTMYYPRFVEELFKPQEMYSVSSTRQIFDRLAHSSIMRLNESSMDKLFDLMAMGFKYQTMSVNSPQELLDVTNNHLDVIKRLVSNSAPVSELLDVCVTQTQAAYSMMPLAEFNTMRQHLCNFFQDRKVKVSLFLHDQTQSADGSLVVPPGGTLPIGGFVPGTVRYFDQGVETGRTALPVCIADQGVRPATGMRTHLGLNVYSKDPRDSSAPSVAATVPAPLGMPAEAMAADAATSAATAAAVGEVNMLASLIGGPAVAAGDTFKLESLFGENVFASQREGARSTVIQIDGGAPSAHTAGLDAVRSQFDFGGAPSAQDAPDDLLDLMDRA